MKFVFIVISVHFSYCSTKADVNLIGSGPPSLDDLVKTDCPAEKPFICLPYGVCCAGHEFCYSGACETCFPKTVKEDDLSTWCKEKGQYNITLMRHHSCSLACQARFNSSVLSPLNEQITVYKRNISLLTLKLFNATKEKDTHNSSHLGDVWSGLIGGIVGAVLTIVIICFIYTRKRPEFLTQVLICLRNCRGKQTKRPSIEEKKDEEDQEAAKPMMETKMGETPAPAKESVINERHGFPREPEIDHPTVVIEIPPVNLGATASLSNAITDV